MNWNKSMTYIYSTLMNINKFNCAVYGHLLDAI